MTSEATTSRSGLRWGPIVMHAGLVIAALAMVFPFIWMVLTSVKTLGQLLNAPLSLLPDPFTWDNYINSWNAVAFPLAYWNSAYIAVHMYRGMPYRD